MVTETPETYRKHVQPYMRAKREEGRLNWVFNILEGRTEQEDVILRDDGGEGGSQDAFLMLPDLNWDRETMGSLHLLALVQRRDIWSLRDLKKGHVSWLKYLRERVLKGTVEMFPGIERDMLKLYVHCEFFSSFLCFFLISGGFKVTELGFANRCLDQPTYYHFHVHVVNVMLEAGTTQATGKAFGLENLISQLETMDGDENASMADVDLTYFLGEASELWTDIFKPLKQGKQPGQ
jgi:m7GpppX diphosphatase